MKCAHKNCTLPTSGKSKYCLTHKREARAAWLEMIQNKSSRSSKPAATPSDKLADKQAELKEFRYVLNECLRAAQKAEKACVPTPMVVVEHTNMIDDSSPIRRMDVVNSGVCGVLIVKLPRQYKFTKWLVAEGHAHAYDTWTSLRTPYTQSYERLQAWWRAFHDKLDELMPDYSIHVKYTLRED